MSRFLCRFDVVKISRLFAISAVAYTHDEFYYITSEVLRYCEALI